MPFVYENPGADDALPPDTTPLIPEVVEPPAVTAVVGGPPKPEVRLPIPVFKGSRPLRKREAETVTRLKQVVFDRIERFPEDNPLLVLMNFMNNPKVSVKVRAWCADRIIKIVMPRQLDVNIHDAKGEFEDLAANAAVLTSDPRLRAALEEMAANRAALESAKDNPDEVDPG